MSRKKSFTAYLIHAFTALGAPLGLAAIIFTSQDQLQMALYMLTAAVVIDAVDGTMARMLDIEYYGYRINGALLDNIIDYVNWSIAPLFWAFYALEIPVWALLAAAFASSFGFSNQNAKTEDDFFLGFPSYWNIVVFFLFFLQIGIIGNTAIILLFALATFIPVKFVYPSKTPQFQKTTLILGLIFMGQLVMLLIRFEEASPLLIYSSLLYPVYYFIVSFYLHFTTPKTT